LTPSKVDDETKAPSWIATIENQRTAAPPQDEIDTMTFPFSPRNVGKGAEALVPMPFYDAILKTIREGKLPGGWGVQLQTFEVIFTVPREMADAAKGEFKKEFRKAFTSKAILAKTHPIAEAFRNTVSKQKRIAVSSASG
jgi:hypothetical protein